MTTNTIQHETAKTLGQTIGGQWHWSAEHNAHFLDTTPALRDCYSAILTREGYAHQRIRPAAAGPLVLAMSHDQAMLAIYHASDQGHGETKPSLLKVHMDKAHRGWQTEALQVVAKMGGVSR